MEFYNTHILTVILFTPLVGAMLLLFVPRESENAHRVIGNLFALLGLLVSLPLVWRFNDRACPATSSAKSADWIPSIGAHYTLGIDGISFLLVMLTTLLGAISILSSWSAIKMRRKEYYILFLLLAGGHAGRFHVARFLPLLPVLGSDAGADVLPDRRVGQRPPAVRGDQVLPVHPGGLGADAAGDSGAVLSRAEVTGQPFTFDIPTLLAVGAAVLDTHLQVFLFWGFFFAFAIKVPMFPFHTWLPDAHTEAPTAGSVILAGVLLKMGTYGFIRFSLPLLPHDRRRAAQDRHHHDRASR